MSGEERRGEEITEIIIREWYKIMKASERERERENERREGSHEESANPERRIAMSRAHPFWLLSFVSGFFFIIFVTPLNGWKRGVCVGVEKDKVI